MGIEKTLLITIICLITLSSQFEDKEFLEKRYNFYKMIEIYSNNTITVGKSENKGLYCVSKDYFEYGQLSLLIPKDISLCPYYIFPFKYEFIDALDKIDMIRSSIGKEQKYSVYLLIYQLLYFMNAPKQQVIDYIKEHKLEQYYKLTEIDERLRDSFPKEILNTAILEKEHYDLLKSLGYAVEKASEMEIVFKSVLSHIYSLDHSEIILPWISDFDKFKWAYAAVMSRGMTVRYNEYMILENLKINEKNLDKWGKKNLEVNKRISQVTGVPCIIPFIDLCNHYQPQYTDKRDKKPIILDTQIDYFLNRAPSTIRPGEEISFTYTEDPSNIINFLHYGFVIPFNIFNFIKVRVDDTYPMTTNQFNLCKEIRCFETPIASISKVPNSRSVTLFNTIPEKSLLNYARVKYLQPGFDHKNIIKTVLNNQIISIENEIQAWMFYYKVLKFASREDKAPIISSIRNAQTFRNKVKKLESEWKEELHNRNKWRRLKSFENIYALDISYKINLYRHIKLSANNLIINLEQDLSKIRDKYLN